MGKTKDKVAAKAAAAGKGKAAEAKDATVKGSATRSGAGSTKATGTERAGTKRVGKATKAPGKTTKAPGKTTKGGGKTTAATSATARPEPIRAAGTAAAADPHGEWTARPQELLRADGSFDLASFDRGSTPGWDAGKAAAKERLAADGERMSELQERLFAAGRTGGDRSVLLVLQGMDTAGKGGIVRHVLGMVDPQGVALRSFGVPTPEEARHHYLWRIRRALPKPGYIGVFDRSHYEDVLVVRVESLVPQATWERRYDEINAFEAKVAAAGTTVVKAMLVVSPEEQTARLRERLERPDKHWKYNPGDVDARQKWGAYQEAYQAVLERTSTPGAPWYVVPADRKWYARLAIGELVLGALQGLDLGWPIADFDPQVELARLEASTPR